MSKTYKKPNIRIVDMCKYFDEHIHLENRNDSLLFEYLYHIIYSLSFKWQYFHVAQDYDDFAVQSASIIYMRCLDPRRGKYEGTGRELKEIKSILNYLKSCLPMLKVDFERCQYAQVIDPNEFSFINGEKIENDMKVSIQQSYNDKLRNSVMEDIEKIPYIAKKVISKCAYRNDKVMCKNIYLSCILTFLDSITLPNQVKSRLDKKEDKNTLQDNDIITSFQKQKNQCCVLWHIPESLSDYIIVLTNKIKNEFAKMVEDSRDRYMLTDEVLHSIMMTSYNTYDVRGDDNEN